MLFFVSLACVTVLLFVLCDAAPVSEEAEVISDLGMDDFLLDHVAFHALGRFVDLRRKPIIRMIH
jgi:hypothetical protein